ncbi:LAGLIDADG family homing endonuclease [Rhodocaloribacter sp.]
MPASPSSDTTLFDRDTPEPEQLERGLTIARVFSAEGADPFDSVTWETRDAVIKNHTGQAIFEQKGVEFPKSWSRLATNVVASKYFYGDLAHTGEDPARGGREHSLRQLIHRVTRTIADWGIEQHYFATKADGERFYDELTWLCLNQYGSFNSPVWFNVGLHQQYGVRDTGGKTIYGWDRKRKKIVEVDPYERPQASACFIISVKDSIDDIWQLMGESARLFKYGSGVGADWSKLRSSREKLSGGGIPSGPVSFMRVQDATGGTIKSGGKTRRAAIMQTLKVWHPDIMEFVEAKQEEEKKAWALIEQGYDGSFNGPAYGSVAFQNVNQSVRVTDEFMHAADNRMSYALRAVLTGDAVEEVDAAALLTKIAEGTWICGDPGLQYEDTIQKWHTCKNSGPINSSNPCVTGDTLVATADGLRRIDSLLGETPKVVGLDGKLHRTTRVIETGVKPVYRLRTKSGYEVKLTADHRVWTENRGDVPACELTRDDVVRLVAPRFGAETLEADVAEYVGLMLGDGCVSGSVATLTMHKDTEWALAEKAAAVANRFERSTHLAGVTVTERATSATVATAARAVTDLLAQWAVLDKSAARKRLTDRALRLDRQSIAALLRGLFTADGTVVDSTDKSRYVGLDSSSEELLRQVQLLLLGFGIKSKIYRNRRLTNRALLPDGRGGLKEYPVEQMHSLRITRDSRVRFEHEIGFMPESPKAEALRRLNERVSPYRDAMTDRVVTLELLGEEPVYDLTEPVTDHFVANGVAVHNCSEYMFLDNSACNLASLNLRKFLKDDGTFDVERFRAAARLFITAMEILVDNAGYPSASIAENSHAYRPLGLGFANLGALLMSMGIPYDSDEGRAVAGAVMAIEHCEAFARSAEIAANRKIGPFDGYERNRTPFLEVMRMHRAAVADIDASCPAYLREAAQASADRMVLLGERHGYRNAQATVLAPTGTIAFMMDCDTTGIEPDIALVKYKLLAGKGDGLLKIVNRTVPEALERLGYGETERAAILEYIEANDTIEGAPGLREEHLPVFDCAFKPFKGTRSIHHMGHIRMMAACQPFISGAISKCVTGDTLILTEQGIIPIGQFYGGEKPDSFRKMDLKLASIDEPQKADLFYYGGMRPTIKLTLADGRTIEGTPNHRVKVANETGYDWKHLSQITAEDYVAIRLGTDLWASEDVEITFRPSPLYGCQKSMRVPARVTPELGWLLGAYIAEGNKNRSNWTVCITNNNRVVLERCQAAVLDLFGLEGKIVVDARNGVKSLVVASKSLYELLDWLGCGGDAGTKEMPWAVLQSSRATVQAFVGGLWLDGFVRRKDGMTAICLKSEALIRQLQVVLNNFGLRANIIQKHNKVYDRTFHQLCLHGHDVCRFAALFTLDEPHKRRSLADAVAMLAEKPDGAWSDVVPCYREAMQAAVYADHNTQAWRNVFDKRTQNVSRKTIADFYQQYPLPELAEIVESDVHFVPVRDITSGIADVYDFQVPGNHAFIGNGVINHNTVNMPETTTVEEIADAYVQGWKLGLKAVAIYRENSKRSQPLATSKGGNTKGKEVEASGDGMAASAEPEIVEKIVEKVVYQTVRKRLPDERPSITHKFSIAGHEGYLHIGLYPDTHMPGEIFITMAKEGSTISGLMDAFATSISLALQYGVPLEDMCAKFSHMRFEPSGFTNNRQIPIAKSIMDYIFRYLSLKFLGRVKEEETVNPNEAVAEVVSRSGPATDEKQISLFDEGKGPVDALVGSTVEVFLEAAERANRKDDPSSPAVDATSSFQNQDDAPPCPNCGSITVRSGACYACPNCGSSSGCG